MDRVRVCTVGPTIPAEFLRKLLHIAAAIVPAGYFFLAKPVVVAALLLALLVAAVVETMRFRHPLFRVLFAQLFGPLMRKTEHHHLTGATYLIIGMLLTVLLFPKTVAIYGMFVVILSDALAAVVGRLWGKIRLYRSKTLEGTAAFFVSCYLLGLWLLPFSWWASGLLAVAIAAWEVRWHFSLDNLVLPLYASALAFLLMGIF
jgi:dolichol kinase